MQKNTLHAKKTLLYLQIVKGSQILGKKKSNKNTVVETKKYSLDKSSSESAVFHALNWYEKVNKVDALVLPQPTTPFRSIKRFKENHGNF